MTETSTRTADPGRLARDYSRIADAIAYLEAHYRDQPELDDVAAAVGLSAFHFQRLFRRWAGVSPKRFAQFLTLDHARARLAASDPVLEAAIDAGLSGPSRLHDLFVTYEAMTPGAYRRAGEGVRITWGEGPTPFGRAYAAVTQTGVCAMGFPDAEAIAPEAAIRARWPRAELERADGDVASVLARLGAESGEPITLHVAGTNFQLKVWEALLRLPPGSVASYGALANALGRPRSARAVAGAVSRNPVAWLIPCHRVIRETGRFSDYAWGATRKRAMLAREAAMMEAHSGLDAPLFA